MILLQSCHLRWRLQTVGFYLLLWGELQLIAVVITCTIHDLQTFLPDK